MYFYIIDHNIDYIYMHYYIYLFLRSSVSLTSEVILVLVPSCEQRK
jgi:hypothetical protein